MYILLTILVASLFGIILMIGRKLSLVQEGQNIEIDYVHPFMPDLQKVKDLLNKSTKRYGYLGLVWIIRLHVRSTNLAKQAHQEIKAKLKESLTSNDEEGGEIIKQEVSGFLKMMSDYKHKIRTIKHKIKKEEKNNN